MKNYQIVSADDLITIDFLKVPTHADILEAVRDLRQFGSGRLLLWDFSRGLAFDTSQGPRVFAYIAERLGNSCLKMAFVARNGTRFTLDHPPPPCFEDEPVARAFFENKAPARAWLEE